MTDIVKLRTGYATKVSVLRVGFAGPPGADGSAYDDTPILARITAVEQSIAALPKPYEYALLAGRVSALEGASASVAWTDIADVPAAFPPTAHQHSFDDITGLTTALAAKADAAAVLTLEAIQDAVAAMFQGGTHTNAAISYDDATGTLSIIASGAGASLTQEDVEDFVGGLILQGKGINVTYDDAGNVLSISLSGESFTTTEKNKLAGIASGATANATDAQLRDRSTHTGTQPISSVSGLQTALDGKAPASHTHPYSEITDKPSVFPPAAHSHPWSDLTGVPTEFPPSAHPHTIGDVSGLQTALTTANDTLAALQAEIAEARAQLSAVSTFAAPNAGGIVPGRYYDNATSSTSNTNYTSGADRVDMGLFITSRPLSVDQIGFTVATAGSAAYGRAFVYEAGADGWPSNLIFEGNDDLDLNGANFRGHTLASPITFEANKVYWVGWRFGAATTYAVLRGINVSSAPNLGIGTVAGNTYCTVLRRSIPFATRMPATWGFVESELTTNVPPPSIRMRAT